MADQNEGVHTVRRYYLLKAQVAGDEWDDMQSSWWAKQDAVAGTELAEDFPSREELAAARYTTEEDLDGATVNELVRRVGLTRSKAEAVLAALD